MSTKGWVSSPTKQNRMTKTMRIVALFSIFSFGAGYIASRRFYTRHGHADTKRLMKLSSMSPNFGVVVTVDCCLRPEGDFVPEPLFDGIVFGNDADPKRLTFVLGEGNYLPGLHDLVRTMTVDQTIENVSIDAGWGSRNPNLQATLSFESLQDSGLDSSSIKEGVKLVMANGVRAVVTKVSMDDFTIDANPPMAGSSYLATVKLLFVDPGVGPADLEYRPDSLSGRRYHVATFALGCFWGGELAFMRTAGVVGTKVGYTQGHTVNPTYKQVCSGTTGHTEAMMITFDPSIVTYEELVHLAMDRLGESKYRLNEVGNDKGTQYRHGVYYHDDAQKLAAQRVIRGYGEDCVTECLPAKVFYVAEDYHQQYLLKGGQSARKGEDSTIRCYG